MKLLKKLNKNDNKNIGIILWCCCACGQESSRSTVFSKYRR